MTYRGVFFAADHARSVASRLVTDGFTAQVLQHERDWVVVTDAPEVVLELLVERYGGWLETS
jgi:hypothetical protein